MLEGLVFFLCVVMWEHMDTVAQNYCPMTPHTTTKLTFGQWVVSFTSLYRKKSHSSMISLFVHGRIHQMQNPEQYLPTYWWTTLQREYFQVYSSICFKRNLKDAHPQNPYAKLFSEFFWESCMRVHWECILPSQLLEEVMGPRNKKFH